MEEVTIYTDGACSGNPGPGGWAAILMYKDIKKEISGASNNTTNNIMELTAVIEALKQSNADGVMIGRGIYGKPWLFKQIETELQGGIFQEPTKQGKGKILLEHFNKIIDHYGEKYGIPIARKHIGWYSAGLPGSNEFRNNINQLKDIEKIRDMIKRFFNN